MSMIKSMLRSSSRTQVHPQNEERRTAQSTGVRMLRRVSSSLLPRRARVQDSSRSAVALRDLHPSLLQSASSASGSRLTKPTATLAPESEREQVFLAAKLSKQYNIDHFETRRIVKAWENFRSAPKDERTMERFGKFIGDVFDVENVKPSIAEDAFQASSRGMELCLDDFMAWYIRNMFTDVKNLNGRRSRLDKCQMDSLIAAECGIDALTIRSIRQAFDAYDQDRSGEMEFEEFRTMLVKLMKASADDVNNSRIRLFWDEARLKETTLSFYQFARWYAKTVDNKDTSAFLQSLNEMYCPTRTRSKQVGVSSS
eukprot:TRINITY_DN7581_c0_g1_i1.p1 TRINITY_DN7581_c0_g1~~TRINITY_DN7581_c0_g1_i1.p1  ORF type:complete len:356 (-),score=44.05 TRINITY_DN7581_c0_g1_i1:73-1011(-)